MPLYPVQKAIGGQQALLDEYLPNAERNVFGGKVTLRDMLDFVRGKTAEEQVAGFAGPAINPALPMAVGMYVKPRWGETGSFSALFDKKPRVEISDQGISLTPKFKSVIAMQKDTGDRPWKLSSVIQHPELFEREPELKNIKVTHEYLNNQPATAMYDEANNLIAINANKVSDKQYSAIAQDILHEVQHGIQRKEGWSIGGSPELSIFDKENYPELIKASDKYQELLKIPKNKEALDRVNDLVDQWEGKLAGDKQSLFMRFASKEFPDDLMTAFYKLNEESAKLPSPMDFYRRLAGEVEARDTANRMLMNLEQRRKRMPYAGQGIPLEEMIVR